MNRMGLGLALGAGYLLGRTKKLKLAFALGTLAAGKRLNLSPRAVTELLSQQLKDNPQFKEIGDEIRGDLRGVGKAATGALVERQMEALADRLHGRTAEVRDRLEGVASDGGEDDTEAEGEYDDTDEGEEPEDREDRPEDREDAQTDEDEEEDGDEEGDEDEDEEGDEEAGGAARKRPARKAPAKKSAQKAAAKKAPARKAPAKKTADRKSAAARKTGARTASRGGGGGSRSGGGREGGDDR
ncbi:DNA primase [Streptomyces sp. DSM 15324]|uniref:DNA primase n=1 Tax=Streptomyces sp. DSM 15324 TaxID=1739111 RepID=UPI0007463DC1|nr:DNA primase [Streptomyces sp. DSM 15324]KUO12881.1 DNA primase [Streptomyces sp. DSM 15324]